MFASFDPFTIKIFELSRFGVCDLDAIFDPSCTLSLFTLLFELSIASCVLHLIAAASCPNNDFLMSIMTDWRAVPSNDFDLTERPDFDFELCLAYGDS